VNCLPRSARGQDAKRLAKEATATQIPIEWKRMTAMFRQKRFSPIPEEFPVPAQNELGIIAASIFSTWPAPASFDPDHSLPLGVRVHL
jgi:hypothetical protein